MSDEKSKKAPVVPHKNDLANSGGLNAGSLIDQSLSRLNKGQVQNLVDKAAHEALRLEVKARTQNLDYMGGRKAIEDHIETFDQLDKRGNFTRHSVITDTKIGAGNVRIESKSGPTCFVATTAYGDADHPDVVLLRRFRDEVLINSAIGRVFIAWYWRTGPKIAKGIGWSKVLRTLARGALKCPVGLVWLILVSRR